LIRSKPDTPSRLPAHRFGSPELLTTALTHRSAGEPHNERLEFLGDALLSYIMADVLYRRFPDAMEGELSRLRSRLVRGETLARLARRIGLGSHLRLGPGEAKSGGADRSSILADALEAFIGAVYLDAGESSCRQVVMELFGPLLEQIAHDSVPLKDPKSRLQELCQRNKQPLPEYRLLRTVGADHERSFEIECVLSDPLRSAIGRGSSRRRAEQAAAQALLEAIEHD
jgi:ribonuclease-3